MHSEGAATKHDLEFAKLELKRDIKELDTKIETTAKEMETELKKYVSDQTWKTIRWTSGLLALFVAILKFVLSSGV